MRKISLVFIVIILLFAPSSFVNAEKSKNKSLSQTQELPLNLSSQKSVVKTYVPMVIGTTDYEYQSNGPTGNRCALDSEGGVHFTWMNGNGWPYSNRQIDYNYVDNNENWLGSGLVSRANGAGYSQIDVSSDNHAVIVYHNSSLDFITIALDAFTGFGIYDYYDPPDMLNLRCYWPYLTVDISDNIHIVMCENPPNAGDPHTIGYTVSSNGGVSWSELAVVDTNNMISYDITSSPISDKVGIFYSHPTDQNNQWKNDIYYIESLDGLTWDWQNGKTNLTNYGTGGDSLFANFDFAAVYDFNDDLNVVWNAQYITDDMIYPQTDLYHYNSGTGVINLVSNTTYEWSDSCEAGIYNRSICKMSLGVFPDSNTIFTVYTKFDPSDCSAGGYANGEIFMQFSADLGSTWSVPENLTNSPSPGCQPGDCDSDVWPSVADLVNDNMHIMYIQDKDAGATVQDEGSVTTNPVIFLPHPNPFFSGPPPSDSANVGGWVLADSIGMHGVRVDLFDSTDAIYDHAITDDNGNYLIENVSTGNYTLTVNLPLGYIPVGDSQVPIAISGDDLTIDFELELGEITNDPRGLGFWKHQLKTYLDSKGRPHIHISEFQEYLSDINSHFNNNSINPVTIYVVDQPGSLDDSLETAYEIISAHGNIPMAERASAQLFTTILNVVSLRLSQQAEISEDGATVSQAITYCNDLITDSNPDNNGTAKDIAEYINDGETVPENMIPLTTPNISFRPQNQDTPSIANQFKIENCYPNPFNASTTIKYSLEQPGDITLSIFNLLGQKIATLVDGAKEAGTHSVIWNADEVPSGIYFARLESATQIKTTKMVLLK